MPTATRRRFLLAATATLLLAGCSSSGPLLEESLDTQTGVTVLRASAPIIFYRDISYRAAHARDFVYLGPVEINRTGTLEYFLWFGVWSTLDGMYNEPEGRDGFESVVIVADGEPMTIDATGWTLEALGISDPVYLTPVSSAADVYYRVTIDQVRMLAEARDIEIRTNSARSRHYLPWDNLDSGHAGLQAFVNRALN